MYVRAEYLFFWSQGAELPPLVSTSPSGTDRPDAGVLGLPGTQVLYGDKLTSSGPRSGLRLAAGVKLDDIGDWWLTGDWFSLETLNDSFHASTGDYPILARPFFDNAIGTSNSELVSFPGIVSGEITVGATNELWGAGVSVLRNLVCCQWDGESRGYRIDFLAGYRFLQLSDRVRISERLVTTDPTGPLLVGTEFELLDDYESNSYFNGFELGLRGEFIRNRTFVSAELRVALGGTSHQLDIHGQTSVTVPGIDPISFQGGLYTNDRVIGEYDNREFSVVPQVDLRVGRQLSDNIRCSVGYSFLYWSQVVRAAEQIQTTIDSSQLPSATSVPANAQGVPLYSSSFWAQGLTAGVEWQY